MSKRLTDMVDSWSVQADYDRALMRNMQREIEDSWDFMVWLKMTHPEVLVQYQAVKAVERSAK